MQAALLECSTDNPVCVVQASHGKYAPATWKIQELATYGDSPQCNVCVVFVLSGWEYSCSLSAKEYRYYPP